MTLSKCCIDPLRPPGFSECGFSPSAPHFASVVRGNQSAFVVSNIVWVSGHPVPCLCRFLPQERTAYVVKIAGYRHLNLRISIVISRRYRTVLEETVWPARF